jgi:hypothetical protein
MRLSSTAFPDQLPLNVPRNRATREARSESPHAVNFSKVPKNRPELCAKTIRAESPSDWKVWDFDFFVSPGWFDPVANCRKMNDPPLS